ncbi:hypothetical protein GIS00_18180 [Nakamurella sp. YIM 132087]|uniref:ABC transporter permease n=1 Tax=Nakamurella alba TaxID=2665158 RepID=A0A7K1FNZ9_9ACTN|nr:hypothetical protein [Nakamurella alba]MTD15867.1 hypothetical protein [Nakamurella alba]
MSLVNVERIKLFSTRSPYWCLVAILVASALFALLAGLLENGRNAVPTFALSGVGLGQNIFLVLAALAVTTEYRFGTIRTAFLATPNRFAVLLSKTVVLAVLGAVIGFICAVGAFFLTKLLAKSPPLPLDLQGELWRVVAGHAVLFPICAVIAVAVGSLLRQSAGAVAILLLWPLLVEQLVGLIPTVGEKIGPWLPFRAGAQFVADLRQLPGPAGNFNVVDPNAPTPVQGLLAFLGYAVLIWVIALIVLRRRDA